jgi:Mrp family chromosome partitioning ATPase
MTASRPDAPPPVPTAEVRSHQTAAPRTRLVVAAALSGLLLGALFGAVLGGLRPPVTTATAYVRVAPDPLVASGQTGQPSDGQVNSFLSTEVIFLNSPAFRELVQAMLTTPGAAPEGGPATPLGPDVEIEAARQEASDTVQLLVRAGTERNAVTVGDAAAAAYQAERTRLLNERLDAQIATVTSQLEQAQAALNALPPVSADEAGSVSVERQVAQARSAELLTIDAELRRAREASTGVVSVVQRAYVEPTGGLSPTVAGALGGGTLGVLLTVGTVVVARRFSRRIGGPEDLNRYGVPVLDPEVPFRRVRADALTHPSVESVVATHAPRLAGQRDSHPGVVFVGPGSGVGTSYLALQHALYSARRSPTLLLRASGTDDDLIADGLGVDPHHAALEQLPEGRTSTAQLNPMVQQSGVPGLWVLSADATDETGLGVFERALGDGLVEACLDLDLQVVVDAPALDRSTAGLVAARHCGSAVLVVASGRTRRKEVERALDTFAGWGITLSGLVTNRAPRAAGAARRSGERREPPAARGRRDGESSRPRAA